MPARLPPGGLPRLPVFLLSFSHCCLRHCGNRHLLLLSPSTAGRVLIDDRPVGDYDRKWLKRRVALVSQEPVLYARSIRRCGWV